MSAAAVLIADTHIGDRVPVCRDPDEYHKAMFRKLDAIAELQDREQCPVLVAGDVFDRWMLPPWILREAIERIRGWIAIPGQHDLPQHRLGAYGRSALSVLESAGCVKVLKRSSQEFEVPGWSIVGFPWGSELGPVSPLSDRAVALVHRLVYPDKPPFPGAENTGSTALALLKKMKGFDLIVSGDNHETFYEVDHQGRTLINPGSMMRTTAAQAGHEPCAFLWYAEDNTIERVVLPHQRDVVSREHIEEVEKRDARIEAFISRLRADVDIGLDYRENLERYMSENEVPNPIREIIWEVMDQ